MKKPELLAPAGNFESLIAAVEAGCDAVYLAGKHYGARNFAGNFDNDEIISAVEYCHNYGVKIYVTVNTLIYESEIKNFMQYIDFLYTSNVDAIIIQDIGMFDLIRKVYPNFEIHISTQMHIHNLEGCKFFEEYGASRVVLARETSYDLVKKIREKTKIEIEIFVHGALCISYSGQCLMSSLIGGRSGNRGTCAQCCRQPYELYCDGKKINDNDFILSTRDLNSLDNIGKLIDIGIDSLKIEGRMKRPEYVYLVVSIYRKAIDNYLKYGDTKISENDIYELKKIFNRKFTSGFLFDSPNSKIVNSFRPNHIGIEIGKVVNIRKNRVEIKLNDTLNVNDGIRFVGKNDLGLIVTSMFNKNLRISSGLKGDVVTVIVKDVPNVGDIVVKTTDSDQLKRISEKIKCNSRKVNLSLKLNACLNKKIYAKVYDEQGFLYEFESDYIVQESKNYPTTKDSIIKQMDKTNDTVYKFREINVNTDDNIFIPVKVLNDFRRLILNSVAVKRNKKRNVIKGQYSINLPDYDRMNNNNILIDNKNKYSEALKKKYDEIIIDYEVENIESDLRYKISRVNEYLNNRNGKLLVGELGSVYKYCKDCNVATDFSLNVTNSYSVAFLHSLGVEKVTLSLELNNSQIKKIIDCYHERYNKHPNLEVIVCDLPEAMILKYDLFDGKYKPNSKYYIKDKFNNKFKVIRKNNLTYIYNYYSINNSDYSMLYSIGVNNLRENSIF